LAKTEIKEEARKASRAAVVMAAGGVAALYAVWLLLLTIFFALAIAIPLWASALVLFVVTGILAAILLAAGKKRFQTVQPKPEKTIETVKENVEWMKQQTK
ncbi:MAG TPA: phage holin family protein, partial [Candidatus Dormibacteraeota bacterium]|nr:phage holin family protein [Candidatus Dormibacteraeota bacterium]